MMGSILLTSNQKIKYFYYFISQTWYSFRVIECIKYVVWIWNTKLVKMSHLSAVVKVMAMLYYAWNNSIVGQHNHSAIRSWKLFACLWNQWGARSFIATLNWIRVKSNTICLIVTRTRNRIVTRTMNTNHKQIIHNPSNNTHTYLYTCTIYIILYYFEIGLRFKIIR